MLKIILSFSLLFSAQALYGMSSEELKLLSAQENQLNDLISSPEISEKHKKKVFKLFKKLSKSLQKDASESISEDK